MPCFDVAHMRLRSCRPSGAHASVVHHGKDQRYVEAGPTLSNPWHDT